MDDFVSQTLANAVGTLLAAAVVYLVGVIVGAFNFHAFAVTAAILGLLAGVASAVFGWGLLAGAGWATGRRADDD